MIGCLLQKVIEEMNINNRYGDIVLNASVWDNNNCVQFYWHIKNEFTNFMAMSFFALIKVVVCFIKWKATRKKIN